MHLANSRDAFLFELIQIGLNTARSKGTFIVFELQDLDHVNRRKPTANDQSVVRSLITRPCVAHFILVVVPIDEGILVNQAFANECFRTWYPQFSLPPRPVCQDHRRKTPIVAKILEVQVAAKPGARKEENTGLSQTGINAAVFLFALLPMPARQAIFNLAVGPFVLFDDDHMHPMARHYLRGYLA